MGTMAANVKTWTPHRCESLACDFCIATERDLDEALAPVAMDASPNAGNAASAQSVRLPVDLLARQESVFADVAGH